MNSEPLISVVTTFHNAEKTVAETVSSLLVQNYTRFEHIMVNDGSDDDGDGCDSLC